MVGVFRGDARPLYCVPQKISIWSEVQTRGDEGVDWSLGLLNDLLYHSETSSKAPSGSPFSRSAATARTLGTSGQILHEE